MYLDDYYWHCECECECVFKQIKKQFTKREKLYKNGMFTARIERPTDIN